MAQPCGVTHVEKARFGHGVQTPVQPRFSHRHMASSGVESGATSRDVSTVAQPDVPAARPLRNAASMQKEIPSAPPHEPDERGHDSDDSGDHGGDEQKEAPLDHEQRSILTEINRTLTRPRRASRTPSAVRVSQARDAAHASACLRLRVAASGANLRQIQELLGHKPLDSTQRYTRITGHELRGAVKRLRFPHAVPDDPTRRTSNQP